MRSYSITLAEAAKSDIQEAFLWYERQKENLGRLFEAAIDQAIERLKNYPHKAQTRYDNIRVCLLKKFPCGIHFQIDEAKKTILVLAVFHNAQDPQKWRERM